MQTIKIFLICISIIIVSLGSVFGLTFIQDYLNNHDKDTKSKNIFLKYLISLAITVVISIINANSNAFRKFNEFRKANIKKYTRKFPK